MNLLNMVTYICLDVSCLLIHIHVIICCNRLCNLPLFLSLKTSAMWWTSPTNRLIARSSRISWGAWQKWSLNAGSRRWTGKRCQMDRSLSTIKRRMSKRKISQKRLDSKVSLLCMESKTLSETSVETGWLFFWVLCYHLAHFLTHRSHIFWKSYGHMLCCWKFCVQDLLSTKLFPMESNQWQHYHYQLSFMQVLSLKTV